MYFGLNLFILDTSTTLIEKGFHKILSNNLSNFPEKVPSPCSMWSQMLFWEEICERDTPCDMCFLNFYIEETAHRPNGNQDSTPPPTSWPLSYQWDSNSFPPTGSPPPAKHVRQKFCSRPQKNVNGGVWEMYRFDFFLGWKAILDLYWKELSSWNLSLNQLVYLESGSFIS